MACTLVTVGGERGPSGIDPLGKYRRTLLRGVIALAAGTPAATMAQGIATGTIRGSVITADSTSTEGATVRIVDVATGYVRDATVRRGRFFAQGLDVGARYTITVRRPGYSPAIRENALAPLGEPLDLRFVLHPQARALERVTVTDAAPFSGLDAGGGPATTVRDSLVARLPTINRNVYDLVQLAPQVTTGIAGGRTGVSAAGSNHRFNAFLIDGAEERGVHNNLSAAVNSGKSIPLDAVREYQVNVAPYDVRAGDFAGALVNTVTRSGTNELHGTAFAVHRSERLVEGGPGDLPFERLQYGFSLGGPVVRDRVHFFVAPEFQRRTTPAPGPWVGQPASARPTVPVSGEDIARLASALEQYGLAPGSGGRVEIATPLRNLFARVDAVLPRWNGRVTASLSWSESESRTFSRLATDTFNLSTYAWGIPGGSRLLSFRVESDLPGWPGAHNEFQVSATTDRADPTPVVRQPLVRVSLPGTGGTLVTVNAGSAEQAQGRYGRGESLRLRDDASLPVGDDHLLRIGIQAERFRTTRGGVNNGYGTWSFASIAALEQGLVDRYELGLVGSSDASLGGWQYAAWVGDEWHVTTQFVLTTGLRLDVLDLADRPPYVTEVDSIFGRRTDVMPGARIHVSPRVGFTWDRGGEGRDRVRGGMGIFTGRPPPAWLVPALTNYGTGASVLRCGALPTDGGPPPVFVPDFHAAPQTCGNGGPPVARQGNVNLTDNSLLMARVLRTSVAYDRRLPLSLVLTTEVLYSNHLSDFAFENLNLSGPVATDRFGRVMYGQVSTTGVASPALRSRYAEVIDLVNVGSASSVQASVRLERPFTNGLAASASYTRSRTRDAQTLSRINSPGLTLWGDARVTAGRHDDRTPGTSLYDVPHRVTTAVTWSPQRWPRLSLSFLYVGESGRPFTYVATGAGRRGDLNADGSNINDPIYVPRSAMSPSEIRFSGQSSVAGADNSPAGQAGRALAQRQAFDRFIAGSPCLRANRGRILARNACREPWLHTTVAAVRHVVPLGTRALDVGMEAFNVLNLLRPEWGTVRTSSPGLLEHVGQTMGPDGRTEPIFRFDASRAQWSVVPDVSAWQVQFSARLRF